MLVEGVEAGAEEGGGPERTWNVEVVEAAVAAGGRVAGDEKTGVCVCVIVCVIVCVFACVCVCVCKVIMHPEEFNRDCAKPSGFSKDQENIFFLFFSKRCSR